MGCSFDAERGVGPGFCVHDQGVAFLCSFYCSGVAHEVR